jgi:hypothetical protein
MTGLWFSPGTPVFSTNKTDHHDIADALLKMAFNNMTPTPSSFRRLIKEIHQIHKEE